MLRVRSSVNHITVYTWRSPSYCACISSEKAEINLLEEFSRTPQSQNFAGELLKRPVHRGFSIRMDVSFCKPWRITSMPVLNNLYHQSQALTIATHFADPCLIWCFGRPSWMAFNQERTWSTVIQCPVHAHISDCNRSFIEREKTFSALPSSNH